MPYVVVSKISNPNDAIFNTINEFNAWYYNSYPVKKIGKSIQMTVEDSRDQMSVSKDWNKDNQTLTITRTYASRERYDRWEELFKLSGNVRHLEKVVDEYIIQ